MKFALEYGRRCTGSFWGLQKTILLLVQTRYITVMHVNHMFEESREYLEQEWIGKKKRAYEKCKIDLELRVRWQEQNHEKYETAYATAGGDIQKNSIYAAKRCLLNHQYEEALKLLMGYPVKYPYQEIRKKYLMGYCYDKMGNKTQAADCMRYVAENGNTLPCRKQAEEWIQAL